MDKRIFVGILVAVSLIPAFASAADQCVSLTRTLSKGSTSKDVTLLQQFLLAQGLLDTDSLTGFFGPLTEAAVKKFQCNEGLVCDGSPETTGWGVVGPLTRARIAERSCGAQTPPPRTQPPICSLTADSAIIYAGENSTISWTSTNAEGAVITPNIGSVPTSGSKVVSPSQTTVYTGVFTGIGGASTCRVTVTVLDSPNDPNFPKKPVDPGDLYSCTFNGTVIKNGGSVVAYQSPVVAQGLKCASQVRTCVYGSLFGTYQYASCTVQGDPTPPPTKISCSFDGKTIADGESVIAYQNERVTKGSTCVSEFRTCAGGSLSGSYQYSSCVVSGDPILNCPVYQLAQCLGGHYESQGYDENGCQKAPKCVLDTVASCTYNGASTNGVTHATCQADLKNSLPFTMDCIGGVWKDVIGTSWGVNLTSRIKTVGSPYENASCSLGNTASASDANANLASVLTALEEAVKALIGKLR